MFFKAYPIKTNTNDKQVMPPTSKTQVNTRIFVVSPHVSTAVVAPVRIPERILVSSPVNAPVNTAVSVPVSAHLSTPVDTLVSTPVNL